MNADALNQGVNICDVPSGCPLSFDSDDTNLGSSPDSINDSFLGIEDDIPILDDMIKDITPDDDTADDVILGAKMCPTRHGCTGATNCNYDYASYPG